MSREFCTEMTLIEPAFRLATLHLAVRSYLRDGKHHDGQLKFSLAPASLSPYEILRRIAPHRSSTAETKSAVTIRAHAVVERNTRLEWPKVDVLPRASRRSVSHSWDIASKDLRPGDPESPAHIGAATKEYRLMTTHRFVIVCRSGRLNPGLRRHNLMSFNVLGP